MREPSTGRGGPSELSVEGNVRGEKGLALLFKVDERGCWRQINIVLSG